MKKVQFAKAFKNIGKKVVGIFLKMKKLLKPRQNVGMLKLSNYNKKDKSVFANTLKVFKTVSWLYRVIKMLYMAAKAVEYIYKMLM